MKKYLVSACLLGENCKYSGDSNRNEHVISYLKQGGHQVFPICPEVMGGLPTPRAASEICGDRVINREGRDVTEEFCLGAAKSLEIAEKNGCTEAILKERSPSCGCGTIYDGTFTGTVTEGDGMTARALKAAGISITGESAFGKK